MAKWIAVVAAFVLATACTRRPADELTIEFSRDDDYLFVTAESALESTAARDAALAGVDPWAVRFARLNAERERTTFEKTRGTLDRVVHSMRIPRRDLQLLFADTSITVDVAPTGTVGGPLTFYPGTSTRATRAQHEHFNAALTRWSLDVARYYDAVHRLYTYMDANPDRVVPLYEAILAPADAILPPLFAEEQPYVDQLLRAMDGLVARMDEEEPNAERLAEEADLIFNPFPARVTVNVPGTKPLVIEPIDLYEEIKTLEGRWISPDPLLAFMRDETLTAVDLARLPRRSTFGVRPSDVEHALREKFKRPDAYTMTWGN